MSEPEYIDPKQLTPGPIRNQTLSPEILLQVKTVYDLIGPYLDTNLEQFEISFMRDMHPESEVGIWISITAAWIDYHEKYLNDELLTDDEEKNLLGALLAISMGVEDVSKMKVSVEVGGRLIKCYQELGNDDE